MYKQRAHHKKFTIPQFCEFKNNKSADPSGLGHIELKRSRGRFFFKVIGISVPGVRGGWRCRLSRGGSKRLGITDALVGYADAKPSAAIPLSLFPDA